MGVSEIIALITAIITVFGFCATLWGLFRNRSVTRAELIKGLIDKMRGDDEIRGYIYYVDDEDNEKWYTDLSFYDKEKTKGLTGKQVDKALTYLSYLCYLKKRRLINKNEFAFFRYEIRRVFKNKSTVDYLCNLYHYSFSEKDEKDYYKMSPKKRDKEKKKTCPFIYLIKYGEKNGFIKPNFYRLEALKEGENYKNLLFKDRLSVL